MIHDRIVVGLHDTKLSESLQLDPDLTLEKPVTKARQAEAVKQQQPLVRGPNRIQSPVGSYRQPYTHLGVVTHWGRWDQSKNQKPLKDGRQGPKPSSCG